jgi:hypothetical protein
MTSIWLTFTWLYTALTTVSSGPWCWSTEGQFLFSFNDHILINALLLYNMDSLCNVAVSLDRIPLHAISQGRYLLDLTCLAMLRTRSTLKMVWFGSARPKFQRIKRHPRIGLVVCSSEVPIVTILYVCSLICCLKTYLNAWE